jgi:hypothetical protein
VPSTGLETMPYPPSRQACARTIGPSSAMCSFNFQRNRRGVFVKLEQLDAKFGIAQEPCQRDL